MGREPTTFIANAFEMCLEKKKLNCISTKSHMGLEKDFDRLISIKLCFN